MALHRALGRGRIAAFTVAASFGVLLCGIVAPPRALAGPAPCVGDCNGDQMVTIDELIVGVAIALEQRDAAGCLVLDTNGDQLVTIDELVRAVNNALSSCAPESPLGRGLASLAGGNLLAATDAFTEAYNAQPDDPRVNLYLAVTRLVTNALRDPRVVDLLGRGGIGVSGNLENVCALRASSADTVPEGAPRSGEILDAAHAILVPELQAAVANLARIPADAVIAFDVETLPACTRRIEGRDSRQGTIEIDHGDVLALTAVLHGVQAFIELTTAYNLDGSLHDAATLPARTIFDSGPDLLTLRSADPLSAARTSTRLALTALIDAIDAIRSETDDQSDDLLVIVPDDVPEADRLRQIADLGRQALDGEVVLPTDIGLTAPQRLNLNPFFSASFQSLRGFFPGFDDRGDPDQHQFPDPTFGGTTPDLTQSSINDFIAGAPVCEICQSDADCQGVSRHHVHCNDCAEDCSGSVRRCGDGFRRCEDGHF